MVSDILIKNLNKNNRGRIIRLAQYFYLNNRITYTTFLYIQTKPLY